MIVFFPLSEDDALAPLSRRWLIAAGCMTLFIWGNWLSGVGLPSAWLTNLLVRKMAHFSEYALLSILIHSAFSTGPKLSMRRFAMVCVVPVMGACVDETIQRFVPGRCGTPVDVLIDCCGAAFGILVCHVMGRVLRRRKTGHE